MDRFINALRVNHSVTANLEKRVLAWLARHTPAVVHSDHLTLLALLAQVGAGCSYALSSRDARALWFVNVFLALNWLGDSLDGTLARERRCERPRYGFYVDHIADTFGAVALTAGLACSGYMHWQVAAGLLITFYALSIETYLATYTLGRFHLSHSIFGPTEVRILLAVGNVVASVHAYARIAGHAFLFFDVAGVIAMAAMGVVTIAATARHTAVLYREETTP